ncbi:MAG TPA: DUF2167 domain-containing protein [Gemmatimonadaceae bacterium]|nr:DUF2167 domain-containing protein [Gemmatimonadaceae bacterium]
MRPSVSPFIGRTLVVACLIATLSPAPVAAQSDGSIIDRLEKGPMMGRLGLVAEVGVPSYCRFGDAGTSKDFLLATENAPSGKEVGVILCQTPGADSTSYWFVVFTFDQSGYVKDDEKTTLDPTKILTMIQSGTEAANPERRARGWNELEVLGWERPPYYDSLTHNLTWSTRLREKGATGESINHSVRLLGRRGVMHVDLVADPKDMATAVAAFDSILTEYSYFTGHTYAEWRPGDKVASYGLTALIATGAGAAAVQLGFFPKIWKFIIGIFLALKKAVIALFVAIGAFFRKKFGKKEQSSPPTPAPAKPGAPAQRSPGGAYKPGAAGAPAPASGAPPAAPAPRPSGSVPRPPAPPAAAASLRTPPVPPTGPTLK